MRVPFGEVVAACFVVFPDHWKNARGHREREPGGQLHLTLSVLGNTPCRKVPKVPARSQPITNFPPLFLPSPSTNYAGPSVIRIPARAIPVTEVSIHGNTSPSSSTAGIIRSHPTLVGSARRHQP